MASDQARYDDNEQVPCHTCAEPIRKPTPIRIDADLHVHHLPGFCPVFDVRVESTDDTADCQTLEHCPTRAAAQLALEAERNQLVGKSKNATSIEDDSFMLYDGTGKEYARYWIERILSV